jgi:hypothetical protein
MNRVLLESSFGFLFFWPLIGLGSTPPTETKATVQGTVLVDGAVPARHEWKLEETMQQLLGEKVYREETWLVGQNRGLANCVVTLKATQPANRVKPLPLPKTIVDKVGVRYVPRVLVVTPDTEVVFRNRESPCRGFYVAGGRAAHQFNFLIHEGRQESVTFQAPDLCSLTCPVRPYAKGYIRVVDTPYYAVTDAQGHFSIKNVPAGEYQVTVWHEAVGKLSKEAGPLQVTIKDKEEITLHYQVRPPLAKGRE